MARKRKNHTEKILVVLLGNFIIAAPSHAYLDPGTGSIILQSLLASIAVAFGLVRHYWFQLKSFFAGSSGSSREVAEKDQQATEPFSEHHKDT